MNIFQIIALAIILGALYFAFIFIQRMFTPNGIINTHGAMICQNCGSRGEPKTITKGSIMIELILWLCFIIPGLIYSFWRLSNKQQVCPACGSIGMMNVNTPNGKLLVEKFNPQTKVA